MHHRKYEKTSKERSKGTQNGAQKRRQSPELFWVAKSPPKGNQNGHPEFTKASNMAPRGAKMDSREAKSVPRTLSKQDVYSRQLRDLFYGAKRVPKGFQNGSKMESETAHIFKPFRAAIWGPFWHLLGTQNGPNSRHNNMAKTKVRTTCGNAKMMEKRWENNIFEQFCNPGGRPKLAKIKQKRWSENKTETVHVLEAFWHTLGPLLGAQNDTKLETKTKTKLERQKGGSEGSKRKNGEMRRDPSMHSILL